MATKRDPEVLKHAIRLLKGMSQRALSSAYDYIHYLYYDDIEGMYDEHPEWWAEDQQALERIQAGDYSGCVSAEDVMARLEALRRIMPSAIQLYEPYDDRLPPL